MSDLVRELYQIFHPTPPPHPDPLTLAEKVKHFIEMTGINQSECARQLKVSEARISQLLTIERGLTVQAREAVRGTDLSVGVVYEVARLEPHDQNAWAETIEERYK